MYFRQFRDRYGVGSYRHEPLMVDPRDLGKTAMLPFTPEHYEVAWQAGCELMPTLKNDVPEDVRSDVRSDVRLDELNRCPQVAVPAPR